MSVLAAAGQVAAAVALLAGGMLTVVAGLGLVRLPDVVARLQAATKTQVLGLVLVCAGAAPLVGGPEALALVLVVLFQLTVAPVIAQLVGRAAHRSGADRGTLAADESRRER